MKRWVVQKCATHAEMLQCMQAYDGALSVRTLLELIVSVLLVLHEVEAGHVAAVAQVAQLCLHPQKWCQNVSCSNVAHSIVVPSTWLRTTGHESCVLAVQVGEVRQVATHHLKEPQPARQPLLVVQCTNQASAIPVPLA
jgi:hypothetical protein